MPWQECSVETLRQEFVLLASRPGTNIRELCRRFSISPDTAYTLLARYRQEGIDGLRDRSRRPLHSPLRTDPALEAAACAVRVAHPAWGGRKIRRYLLDHGQGAVPAASTITDILRRHDLLDPREAAKHRAGRRFEADAPNDLWQMDFKGHIALRHGRCHPLTVLDDHSRYCLALAACGDERSRTVQNQLITLFARYGLPWRLLADNGAPWGDGGARFTALTVWLLRLGITVTHGRAYHPQTQGKEERFHRTLKAELLAGEPFAHRRAAQERFDAWRVSYNQERPHEALGLATPSSRYVPSARRYPTSVPAIEYGPDDAVRKVQADGEFSFANRVFRVSKAFRGERVAIRPTPTDGVFVVAFMTHRIAQIDLRDPVL
jgi:transposase InsO family protein